MSTVITPFQGTDSFSTATFNNRISQINTGFSYISNPNLLDNPYFGNLVDQRGGYVVPPGTTFYGDSSLSNSLGTTPSGLYQTVTLKTSTYARYKGTDGVDYYCAASDVVRGYTGAGYGIDRWKASNPYTVLIKDGYLQLISGVQNGFYAQPLDGIFAKLSGKTVTMSILAEVISGEAYLNVRDGKSVSKKIINGLTSVTKTIISAPTEDRVVIYATEGAVINVYAAKLELGSQQTLAHQDENGVWQLNEIPDYGEQLARCMRYYQRITNPSRAFLGISTVSANEIWIPILTVPMRKIPTVTVNNVRVYKISTNSMHKISSTACYYINGGYPTITVYTEEAIGAGFMAMLNGESNAYLELNAEL